MLRAAQRRSPKAGAPGRGIGWGNTSAVAAASLRARGGVDAVAPKAHGLGLCAGGHDQRRMARPEWGWDGAQADRSLVAGGGEHRLRHPSLLIRKSLRAEPVMRAALTVVDGRSAVTATACSGPTVP